MSLRNWILDAVRVGAAYLTKEHFSPILKGWVPQLADILVDLVAIIGALIIVNILLSLIFGLPRITVIWKDQDENELTGTELRANHGSGALVHAFDVQYACESYFARKINAHFRKKRARLTVSFDSTAVEVVPDIALTQVGHGGSQGTLSLSLDSDVLSGLKTWCAFSLAPKNVPNNYRGEIRYAITGDGKAMVVWSWLVKPRATVKILHLVRS